MKKTLSIALLFCTLLFSQESDAKYKSNKKTIRQYGSCGPWTNYYNQDGKISYRIRQCEGYSQMHRFIR